MSVKTRPLRLDIRGIELAILRECAACTQEDYLVTTYGSSETDGVVLFTHALAKHLLGIRGAAIGQDPRRARQLGLGPKMDWDAERAEAVRIYSDDNYGNVGSMSKELREETIRQRFKDIRRLQEWAEESDGHYDPDAWRKVLEVQDIINRRSRALHNIDLVVFEGLMDAPQEMAGMESLLPDNARALPGAGTVQISRKGMLFLSRGDRLEAVQDGSHPLDQPVRVLTRQ